MSGATPLSIFRALAPFLLSVLVVLVMLSAWPALTTALIR
jgi:TRAP-type mannitol/chloroaromatic compound transport system permease large subunit